MIHVDRNQADETGTTILPSQTWFQRASEATSTALEEKEEHDADRDIYADDEVKMALERLFHDKCAYCESKITATADWDVEHFRPKGRVAERKDHPGYYWLTYDWENLYPSCQHCNQRRRDRPRWGNSSESVSGGKVDQFPLLHEASRAMSPSDDVREEDTLLIDPCLDDPDHYLGYDPTGQLFALQGNPYGNATINVMNLNRSRLRASRVDAIRAVLGAIRLLLRDDSSASLRSDIQAFLDGLTSAGSEYAGLARHIVALRENFGL